MLRVPVAAVTAAAATAMQAVAVAVGSDGSQFINSKMRRERDAFSCVSPICFCNICTTTQLGRISKEQLDVDADTMTPAHTHTRGHINT